MVDGHIRLATVDDVPELVELIQALADHMESGDEVDVTADDLTTIMFGSPNTPTGSPTVWCTVVEHDGPDGQRLGGMALWYLNFSTWRGTHGIFLEDLYVREQVRGHRYGVRLLASLAAECVERGYARLMWEVDNANTGAVAFYDSLNAHPKSEWTTYLLSGDELREVAKRAD